MADFEQNLQNKWHAFTDDARHLQQSDEANYAHLNTGMRLKSSCVLMKRKGRAYSLMRNPLLTGLETVTFSGLKILRYTECVGF